MNGLFISKFVRIFVLFWLIYNFVWKFYNLCIDTVTIVLNKPPLLFIIWYYLFSYVVNFSNSRGSKGELFIRRSLSTTLARTIDSNDPTPIVILKLHSKKYSLVGLYHANHFFSEPRTIGLPTCWIHCSLFISSFCTVSLACDTLVLFGSTPSPLFLCLL